MAPLAQTRQSSVLSPERFRVLVGLFLVSGAAGLVDQVCFSRYLSYIVGATAYAVSAVLAAFMTGLAVGATVGGRLSARVKRPLVAYGVAEVVVGLAVALTPLAFAWLTPLYVHLARGVHGSMAVLVGARWLVAMLLVMVPTAAMGATLPLVSAALARGSHLTAQRTRERRLGTLYGANTFGGALGALAGAYVVLPALGLTKTVLAAALVSASAGGIAIVLGTRKAERESLEPARADIWSSSPPAPESTVTVNWVLVLAFASGVLAFATEVVSTHLLAVIVGNSAYAFGLILAAFLSCLFLGASLAPGLARRLGDGALAASLAITAAAMAGTLPLWDELPRLFVGLEKYLQTFGAREAMRAVVAFAILALPATSMGLTFPLLLRWAAAHKEVGRIVGRLTTVNTLGAVLGALGTGYAVLPALGSERTLLVISLVFAALALGTAVRPGRAVARLPAGLAAAAALFGVVSPRWNIAKLTLGANVYFDGTKMPDQLLSVREDVHGGITTVTLGRKGQDAANMGGVRTLYTNGKFQGNDGWELKAQHYFAHYPCLFVPRFGRALVIGLGTGTTAGTLSTFPWQRIDVLEISPAIAEAARKFFTGPNRSVFEDPRFHVVLDDARNHLLVHEGRYDLVSMELSSVWFAGASSLYSGEYYRLVRAHLAEDGVFQQWVQLHHIETHTFATLLNTLRREFEHVALFYGGGQGVLVSSKRPLRWSRERALRLEKEPGILDTLPDDRQLETLPNDILVMDESLDRFVADEARAAGKRPEDMISTDDNLYLEYETPRGNILPWAAREALVAKLRTYRDEAAILALEAADVASPGAPAVPVISANSPTRL